jgi:hypothetical protein
MPQLRGRWGAHRASLSAPRLRAEVARAGRHHTKRHHMVTRYLELWADNGGRIAVFDKRTGT